MITSYWTWLGLIYLISLTYQEYANKFKVDDKYNYLMFGLTISLYSHIKTHLAYIISIILIGIFINIYFSKIMKSETKNSMLWLLTGFGIQGFDKFLFFIILLAVGTIVYYGLNKLYKVYTYLPFYVILSFIYIVTCSVFGLF